MPDAQTSAADAVRSATRLAPNAASSAAETIERMAAHVEAQRLLLPRQLLRLRPGQSVGQENDRRGRRRRRAAEQLVLALVTIALLPAAVFQSAIDCQEKPRACAPRVAIGIGGEGVEARRL